MTSTRYNKILLLGVATAIVIAGGGVLIFSSPFPKGSTASSQEGFKSSGLEDSATSFSKGGISQEDIGVAEIAGIKQDDFTKIYQNKKYGFSFRYPEGYAVTAIPDEASGGTIVLLQSSGGKSGVQIAISPFEEPNVVLTPSRVEDEAGITVESPQDVLIGESGKGLAFIGKGTDFGTSREVWFVFKKTLYQISTYIELDELLKNILRTWKFE